MKNKVIAWSIVSIFLMILIYFLFVTGQKHDILITNDSKFPVYVSINKEKRKEIKPDKVFKATVKGEKHVIDFSLGVALDEQTQKIQFSEYENYKVSIGLFKNLKYNISEIQKMLEKR